MNKIHDVVSSFLTITIICMYLEKNISKSRGGKGIWLQKV